MAEQFLTLMADLDPDSQKRMSGWYHALKEAGFSGVQTPGLPYHISLATFPPELEEKAAGILRKAAAEFAPVPVHISHVGMFAGGKVLFGGPEKNAELAALREACKPDTPEPYPWTPHATLLIDEPDTVYAAVPVLMKSFVPFTGKITRLHLCAFWPTREIAAAELTGNK
jgi:2'-5' RNA ligase